MTTRLFASMLAGSLMVPHIVHAGDTLVSRQAALPAQTEALALPAIRHLATIPWLSAAQRGKVNTLAGLEASEPGLGSVAERLGQLSATASMDREWRGSATVAPR